MVCIIHNLILHDKREVCKENENVILKERVICEYIIDQAVDFTVKSMQLLGFLIISWGPGPHKKPLGAKQKILMKKITKCIVQDS